MESGARFLLKLQSLHKHLFTHPKVKGLSLPWDIKVIPLSMSAANMEVSKNTTSNGNHKNTEIGLEGDMETTTNIAEINM